MAQSTISSTSPSGHILNYSIGKDNNLSVIGAVDVSGALAIPSTVWQNGQSYTVNAIATNAFASNGQLTSLTIPNTVETIGDYAFYGCISLYSVEIEDGVKRIGKGAFGGCLALEYIKLPKTLKTIDNDAFYACLHLQQVNLPQGLDSIGSGCFAECASLIYVKYESKDLHTSGDPNDMPPFTNCHLKKIVFGDSVASLPDYMFRGIYSLSSITLPNSLQTIGNSTFAECRGITQIKLSDNLRHIGKDAFKGCTGIHIIRCGNKLHNIDEKAFYDCTSLQIIDLGESIESIGSYAFYNCNSLKSIKLPYSLSKIGGHTFDDCSNLTMLTYCAKELTINGTDWLFDHCPITSIIVCDGVETIPDKIFAGLNKMVSVEIASSVKRIGVSSFYGCEAIEHIVLPDQLQSIGTSAFFGCSSLKDVHLGRQIKNIGRKAFAHCGSLQSMIFNSSHPATLDASAFDESSKNITAQVPCGSKKMYSSALHYDRFVSINDLCATVTNDPTANDTITIETGATIGNISIKVIDNQIIIRGLNEDDIELYDYQGMLDTYLPKATGLVTIKPEAHGRLLLQIGKKLRCRIIINEDKQTIR